MYCIIICTAPCINSVAPTIKKMLKKKNRIQCTKTPVVNIKQQQIITIYYFIPLKKIITITTYCCKNWWKLKLELNHLQLMVWLKISQISNRKSIIQHSYIPHKDLNLILRKKKGKKNIYIYIFSFEHLIIEHIKFKSS